MINLEPGDRVSINHTGQHGICQWINWEDGEISVYFGGQSYGVYAIQDVTAHIGRVLKDPAEMSPDELRVEIELLRESRKVVISNSRSKRAKANAEKRKAKPKPSQQDILSSVLTPEQMVKLKEKLQQKKEAGQDEQS